jgi:uncharacterized protein (TIGR03000 family)
MRTFLGVLAVAAASFGLFVPARAEAPNENKAPVVITMLVPAGAEVTFDGTKTTQTGTTRRFESPAIATGKTFKYQIVVVDGTEMSVTRAVRVHGGERITLDFRGGEVRETRNTGTGSAYFEPARYPEYRPFIYSSPGPGAIRLSPDDSPRNQPYGFGGAIGGG